VIEMADVSGNTAGIYYPDAPGIDSTPMNCPVDAPARSSVTSFTTYVYGDCHAVLPTTSPDSTSRTR
jgi:hypothetical protein